MSEPERTRREHVEVRLAELRAAHGDPESAPSSPRIDPEPTWGPVGSLARQLMDPAAYAHLLQLHTDMLALERARKAADHGPEVLH